MRARKPHQCHVCHRPINPGDECHRTVWIFDNETHRPSRIKTDYECHPCWLSDRQEFPPLPALIIVDKDVG